MEEKVIPLSVARYEFVSKLTNLINSSQLPAFVLEAVLKDVYNDIRMIARQQLEKDMESYHAAQQKKGDA